jgi:hypothetical protein
MIQIPGFEPLAALGKEGELVQIIARKQLTKLLGKPNLTHLYETLLLLTIIANVTAPLSVEAAFSASVNLGESTGK